MRMALSHFGWAAVVRQVLPKVYFSDWIREPPVDEVVVRDV
jgi:hypothetical protein